MTNGLQWLGALCTSEPVLRGGVLVGLFLAGLAGSVVHCAPMCGAFVLGQVSERMARLPEARFCEWNRIENGVLLPYHLGRLTTYSALGMVAGGSAGLFGHAMWFGRLSGALLVVAALLFLTLAVRRIWPSVGWFDRAPRFLGQMLGRTTRSIPRGTAAGEFLLGIALGFLPCGFLYAALAAAAASGRPFWGAAAMLAFGLGTVPSLMLVGIAGHAAGRTWNRGIAVVGPVLMALNAMLLLAVAWQRMA